MTLPRKNSRCIEVDEVRYRYIISKSQNEGDGCFSLNLTVQLERGTTCVLQAKGPRTRDVWLDFPEVEPAERYVCLRPNHVAEIIRDARARGWNPHQAGAPFCVNVTESIKHT